MSRLEVRQNAMIVLYDHLLNGSTVDQIIEDYKFIYDISDFLGKIYIDEEFFLVCQYASQRKNTYELALNQFLKSRQFDRLGYIEQAILIMACAELEIGKQDKAVIVNEAVRLAKIFADEDSYRLINGVLDAI